MMICRKITLALLLLPLSGSAQWEDLQLYFDGADTLNSGFLYDEQSQNRDTLWQRGIPDKEIFNSAFSPPKALMTKRSTPYPANAEAAVQFSIPLLNFDTWGVLAIRWVQKLDMDLGKDFGRVEFNSGGEEWESAFDNPYVYDFYGFENDNVFVGQNDESAFSGRDTTWRDIWLCYDLSYLDFEDTLSVRFRFRSDSTVSDEFGPQDGWMIDNLLAGITILHTLEEEEMDDYMRVFPTVTDGRVYIETQKLQESHFIESIRVMDLQGKEVKRFDRRPVKTFIDLQSLPASTYILIIDTNKKRSEFKIVLQ
jgi:hypothetical protein